MLLWQFLWHEVGLYPVFSHQTFMFGMRKILFRPIALIIFLGMVSACRDYHWVCMQVSENNYSFLIFQIATKEDYRDVGEVTLNCGRWVIWCKCIFICEILLLFVFCVTSVVNIDDIESSHYLISDLNVF